MDGLTDRQPLIEMRWTYLKINVTLSGGFFYLLQGGCIIGLFLSVTPSNTINTGQSQSTEVILCQLRYMIFATKFIKT